ncbi:hypothetical protein HK101_008180 [Irineochytrium annulatum]|nr:hypothetical protein HK101_008180 [Irineochytrium annulatum]
MLGSSGATLTIMAHSVDHLDPKDAFGFYFSPRNPPTFKRRALARLRAVTDERDALAILNDHLIPFLNSRNFAWYLDTLAQPLKRLCICAHLASEEDVEVRLRILNVIRKLLFTSKDDGKHIFASPEVAEAVRTNRHRNILPCAHLLISVLQYISVISQSFKSEAFKAHFAKYPNKFENAILEPWKDLAVPLDLKKSILHLCRALHYDTAKALDAAIPDNATHTITAFTAPTGGLASVLDQTLGPQQRRAALAISLSILTSSTQLSGANAPAAMAEKMRVLAQFHALATKLISDPDFPLMADGLLPLLVAALRTSRFLDPDWSLDMFIAFEAATRRDASILSTPSATSAINLLFNALPADRRVDVLEPWLDRFAGLPVEAQMTMLTLIRRFANPDNEAWQAPLGRFDQLTLDNHLALSYVVETETRLIGTDGAARRGSLSSTRRAMSASTEVIATAAAREASSPYKFQQPPHKLNWVTTTQAVPMPSQSPPQHHAVSPKRHTRPTSPARRAVAAPPARDSNEEHPTLAQLTVDAHLALSHALEHQTRRASLAREHALAVAQLTVDEHLALSHLHEQSTRLAELEALHASTFATPRVESYGIEMPEGEDDLELNQRVVDHHLALSHLVEKATVRDAAEREYEVARAGIDARMHLAMSYLAEARTRRAEVDAAFEREVEQHWVDEHLAESYLVEAETRRGEVMERESAGEQQRVVEEHLAMSYRIEEATRRMEESLAATAGAPRTRAASIAPVPPTTPVRSTGMLSARATISTNATGDVLPSPPPSPPTSASGSSVSVIPGGASKVKSLVMDSLSKRLEALEEQSRSAGKISSLIVDIEALSRSVAAGDRATSVVAEGVRVMEERGTRQMKALEERVERLEASAMRVNNALPEELVRENEELRKRMEKMEAMMQGLVGLLGITFTPTA